MAPIGKCRLSRNRPKVRLARLVEWMSQSWLYPAHYSWRCSTDVRPLMHLFRQYGSAGRFYYSSSRSVSSWGDSRLKSPAVFGVCNGRPAIKFRRRKHVAGGSMMIGKSICEEYPAGSPGIHVRSCAGQCAPPGNESVVGRARARERLFPSLNGPLFTDRLRRAPRRFGWQRAAGVGAHSIREGAASVI